jgi:hypothetical protein
MLKTVEGIYQNGQIELTELPYDVSDHVQVLVVSQSLASLRGAIREGK